MFKKFIRLDENKYHSDEFVKDSIIILNICKLLSVNHNIALINNKYLDEINELVDELHSNNEEYKKILDEIILNFSNVNTNTNINSITIVLTIISIMFAINNFYHLCYVLIMLIILLIIIYNLVLYFKQLSYNKT